MAELMRLVLTSPENRNSSSMNQILPTISDEMDPWID